jgi:hypothetical protein
MHLTAVNTTSAVVIFSEILSKRSRAVGVCRDEAARATDGHRIENAPPRAAAMMSDIWAHQDSNRARRTPTRRNDKRAAARCGNDERYLEPEHLESKCSLLPNRSLTQPTAQLRPTLRGPIS